MVDSVSIILTPHSTMTREGFCGFPIAAVTNHTLTGLHNIHLLTCSSIGQKSDWTKIKVPTGLCSSGFSMAESMFLYFLASRSHVYSWLMTHLLSSKPTEQHLQISLSDSDVPVSLVWGVCWKLEEKTLLILTAEPTWCWVASRMMF